jgi:urease accessory protein
LTVAALLLLADGRFPAGGHAHSGGLEAAAAGGGVASVDDLRRFLLGRLSTVGLAGAALAAATCARSVVPSVALWHELDAEDDARTASPALRLASRRQGRQLVRAASVAWPCELLDGLAGALPAGAHHAVALGAASSAAGLSSGEAALVAAYSAVTSPATAAVRLLGLDPLAVSGMLAGLAPAVDRTAAAAAATALDPLADLPAPGAPLLDVGAEAHASWEVRLFAS